MRSRIGIVVATSWLVAGCNGVWGLDDVVVGEASTAESASASASSTVTAASSGATSTSDASSSAETSSGSSGGGGGGGGGGGEVASSSATSSSTGGGDACACGCNSMFPLGGFETDDDVTDTEFDQDALCTRYLDEADGVCHALTLFGPQQSCTHSAPIKPRTTNGSCAVGRVRTKASATGSDLFVGFKNAEGLMVSEVDPVHPGPAYIEFPLKCRLLDDLELTDVYFSTNKKGEADEEIAIDFVEIDIVSCADLGEGGGPLEDCNL